MTRIQFCVLKICKYNTITCFLFNGIKSFHSLSGKTSQQKEKNLR